jgi:MOSC domain-containing protein YiiM
VEATIRAIFIKPQKAGPAVAVSSIQAVQGGLDGDHHTGHTTRRQVLLMSGNVLDELDIKPGTVSENVVVDGLDVMALKQGEQLQFGDALVEVTIPCEPCSQMDRIRYGLQDKLQDRRGMFVRVIGPGTVRVGDRVKRKA